MKFYEALKMCIEDGECITRLDWNGKGQYVFFEPPSHMHEGYFVLHTCKGQKVIGWLASQTDLYSDQWAVWDMHEGMPKTEVCKPVVKNTEENNSSSVTWVPDSLKNFMKKIDGEKE